MSDSSELDELVVEFLAAEPAQRASTLADLLGAHPDQARSLQRRIELLGQMGMLEEEAQTFPESPERLGEFELLERLGQGGMGVVYRALQPSLEREVALKLVRPEQLWFDGAEERFRREVTTVARLSHPGIVSVYSVGEAGGVPYFAMELVRGATLGDVLRLVGGRDPASLSGRDLRAAVATSAGLELDPDAELPALFEGTWAQACLRVVRAVAEALEHAHRSGVLHRDLKPSNLMLTLEGRAMLLDFGLSSDGGGDRRLTRTGSQVGSLPYMAPEVLAGAAKVGRAADVYGLGVTLYELLTLRLPYASASTEGLRAKVLEGRAELPRQLNTALPWEVETVALCAMDRDPARRYATAADLALDLSNALERRPIVARRAGPVLRVRRFVERHPALCAALLLASIVGPATWGVVESRARARMVLKNIEVRDANDALTRSLDETRAAQEEADANLAVAERHLASAWDAVDTMLARVGAEVLSDVPGMDLVRRTLLEDALAFHERLLEEGAPTAQQRFMQARTWRRMSDIQAWLGDYDAARDAVATQRELLTELEASGEVREDLSIALAATWTREAHSLALAARYDEAEGAAQEALQALDRLEPAAVDAGALFAARGDALHYVGDILRRKGEHAQAEEALLEGRRALLAALEERPGHAEYEEQLAGVLRMLGGARVTQPEGTPVAQADLLEARGWLAEARAIFTRQDGLDARWSVADADLLLGFVEQSLGDYDAAREHLVRSAEGFEDFLREHPLVPRALFAVSEAWRRVGELDQYYAARPGADASFARCLEILEQLVQSAPQRVDYRVARFHAYYALADSLPVDARPRRRHMIERAVEEGRRLAREGPLRSDTARHLHHAERMLWVERLAMEPMDEVAEAALSRAEALDEPTELLRCAWVLAGCVPLLAEGEEERRAEFEELALDLLAQALDGGIEGEVLAPFLGYPWMESLRAHPAWAELAEAFSLPR